VRRGRVTGIVRRADGSTVEGVEVDGGVIEADAVVVAMGPWSVIAAKWMSLPAVFGQRSPSLVYDTGTDVPADALFLDYQEDSGAVVTVEVFPRANGNTLVTAFSDQAPLADLLFQYKNLKHTHLLELHLRRLAHIVLFR
jgi:glycine/D-amino acid oxidase-like deaminating enzyme